MTTALDSPTTERAARPKRRWLRIAIAGVLAIVLGYLGFQAYRLFGMYNRGELVDIGDRRLFVSCAGTGSPTVILEHGLDSSGFEWTAVQDAVDDTTRVCFTSRAGMGFSDRPPADDHRTMQDAVDDLTAALTAANVTAPYVLVGHSAGGLSVRLFAAQYPNDVVGMVLVDTTHEEFLARLRQALSPEAWSEIGDSLVDNVENLDLEASSEEVAGLGDLGDLPLVVLEAGISATDNPPPGLSTSTVEEMQAEYPAIEAALQAELAELSTNSTHFVVGDAGHFIHLDRPDVVIDAIEAVLAG